MNTIYLDLEGDIQLRYLIPQKNQGGTRNPTSHTATSELGEAEAGLLSFALAGNLIQDEISQDMYYENAEQKLTGQCRSRNGLAGLMFDPHYQAPPPYLNQSVRLRIYYEGCYWWNARFFDASSNYFLNRTDHNFENLPLMPSAAEAS